MGWGEEIWQPRKVLGPAGMGPLRAVERNGFHDKGWVWDLIDMWSCSSSAPRVFIWPWEKPINVFPPSIHILWGAGRIFQLTFLLFCTDFSLRIFIFLTHEEQWIFIYH